MREVLCENRVFPQLHEVEPLLRVDIEDTQKKILHLCRAVVVQLQIGFLDSLLVAKLERQLHQFLGLAPLSR
jgi:hypothetical protein